MALPRLDAVRYITPLREGGSLPAVVEVSDGRRFVAKFRGAGQGPKALVAEIISGEVARALGLRVPPLALLELEAGLGRTERDEEIRDLLVASTGVNVGLEFLESSLGFDPAADVEIEPLMASLVVALDSFVMNVDRTPRNPNLLWHGDALWLIDHGASLYFHHDWDGSVQRPDRAFPLVAQHVLLPSADRLDDAGDTLQERLGDETLEGIVDRVPDELLPEDPNRWRRAYVDFLRTRRDATPNFVEEAKRARGV